MSITDKDKHETQSAAGCLMTTVAVAAIPLIVLWQGWALATIWHWHGWRIAPVDVPVAAACSLLVVVYSVRLIVFSARARGRISNSDVAYAVASTLAAPAFCLYAAWLIGRIL